MLNPYNIQVNHVHRYNLLGQIPIVGKIFRDFDKSAGENGIHKAAEDVIKKTETKLVVHGLVRGTIDIFKSKSIIIVANHPYDFEVIPLISALPKRNNIFAVVASDLMGAGPNTSSYFIPMFIHKYFDEGSNKLSVRISKVLHLGPRFSPSIEHRKNVDNIEHAASKVKDGGIVIIFPEGIGKKGSPWFSGIGYLLKAIYKKNNTFYARSYIQGTSFFDFLRLIPILRRFFPSVNVYFDRPRKASFVINAKEDLKEITKKLQVEYKRWVSRLKRF